MKEESIARFVKFAMRASKVKGYLNSKELNLYERLNLVAELGEHAVIVSDTLNEVANAIAALTDEKELER